MRASPSRTSQEHVAGQEGWSRVLGNPMAIAGGLRPRQEAWPFTTPACGSPSPKLRAGRKERFAELAAEFVQLKADVILMTKLKPEAASFAPLDGKRSSMAASARLPQPGRGEAGLL